MAAPNIVNLTTITAKTAYITPNNTTANVLLANAASSGKVFKINSITASNIDAGQSYSATVSINTSETGAGTSYSIISNLSVPWGSSVIVSDKSTGIYLEEDKSIVVQSSGSGKIAYIISYEEIY